MQHQYKQITSWTQSEIKHFLEVYVSFAGKKINWSQFLKQFPNRSRQQCISFINNNKNQLQQMIKQMDIKQPSSEDLRFVSLNKAYLLENIKISDYEFDLMYGVDKIQIAKEISNFRIRNLIKASDDVICNYEEQIKDTKLNFQAEIRLTQIFKLIVANQSYQVNVFDRGLISDIIDNIEAWSLLLFLDSKFNEFANFLYPGVPQVLIDQFVNNDQDLLMHSFDSLMSIGGVLSNVVRNKEISIIQLLYLQIMRQASCICENETFSPKTRLQQIINSSLLQTKINIWQIKLLQNVRIIETIQQSIDEFVMKFGIDARIIELFSSD